MKKRYFKRAICLLMCLLLVVVAFAACNTGEKKAKGGLIKIGIINMVANESGYRAANVKDFTDVFTVTNGYLAMYTNKPTNEEQIAAFNTYVDEEVSYILLAAANTKGWEEPLAKAKTAGVKVFLFDRMVEAAENDPSLIEAALVSDMAAEGATAVDWLLTQGSDLKVLHIKGSLGSAAQLGRSGALEAAAAAGKLTIVASGTGGDSWSEDEAQKVTAAAIAEGKDFNVVYAENDGMARGACTALSQAGISYGVGGKVIIMGFDCNKWALQNVLDGKWNYDGQCSPFQASVIDGWIKQLEKGESLELTEKIQFNPEKGFEAGKITAADVDTYGLG